MKRSEMVCVNCVKVRRIVNSANEVVATLCNAEPRSRFIEPRTVPPGPRDADPETIHADPVSHWCWKGKWLDEELTPFVWGEWDS